MPLNGTSDSLISRTITIASKALDKVGCNQFHDYIFGKEVIIETDRKPLVSIMNKPLHMFIARMQHMRVHLQNCNIKVIYIKGAEMGFSDTLSRAHTKKTTPNDLFDTCIAIAAI